jgi:hypothetical protein
MDKIYQLQSCSQCVVYDGKQSIMIFASQQTNKSGTLCANEHLITISFISRSCSRLKVMHQHAEHNS